MRWFVAAHAALQLGERLVADVASERFVFYLALNDRHQPPGTRAQALLEFSYPTYSVFNFSVSPNLINILSTSSSAPPRIPPAISTIGTDTLLNRPPCFATRCGNSTQPYYGLLKDDAAADPASLGIAVLLAGLDEGNAARNVSGTTYDKAVRDEVEYLLQVVPRVGWLGVYLVGGLG
jgi:hypothetical protein